MITYDKIPKLLGCLNVDSLLSGLPEKAKNESIVAEENITKKLYKDYAAFKNDLWLNMVKNNQELDRLLLYKKTQNLLDRFLFILFAEDSGLLPPNLIAHIKQRWNILQDEDAYKPQYEIFKQYFGYINTGNKGKALQDNIFAYNGGLFRPDEILDNIKIDDEVLHLHLKKLSVYNFQSEVDVNILGHIFENSLHDIESVNAKLEGKEVDKRESRRKKDGIYYTPKYITKFIVANTIGKLCKKKKEEFGINEEEYAKGAKGRKKETIKNLHKCLKDYRDWLLKITICDPACGSGAFLNQALEFLIQEHTYIDELESKLFGSSIVFHYVSDHILENNLFGVDINDESIEIAKLSLWLQTAKNGRKLTSLSNNIKCGNSLIDDINVAGEKAFNWPNQFPDIFSKGGFDIVIGNPPWGAKLELKELDHIKDQHKDIIVRMIDSFMFFVDKSIELSKKDGYLGLIIPDVLFYQKDNEKLRKKLNSHTDIIHAINIGDGVFENVSRPSAILIASKDKHTDHFSLVGDFCKKQSFDISTIDYSKIKQSIFESLPFTIFPTRFITGYSILNRLKLQKLSEFIDQDGIQRGVSPDLQEAFILNKDDVDLYSLEKEKIHQTVTGGIDVKRYSILNNDKRIIYVSKKDDPDSIPHIIKHLSKYMNKITCIEVKQGKHPFYTLHRARDESIFTKPSKILGVITGDKVITAVDEAQLYPTDGLYLMNCIPSKITNKAMSAILNSKLITFFYRLLSCENNRVMSQIKPVILANLPIAKIDNNSQQALEKYYVACKECTEKLDGLISNLLNLLQSKLTIEKLSMNLRRWNKLDFKMFLNELKKSKIELSLSEENEWMKYFLNQKQEALELQSEITMINREIDSIIYKCYGLTDDEIMSVESA